MTADEARDLVDRLVAGDFRAIGFVMYGKLYESRGILCQMGESGIEAAIERERAWVRYTSRARHWPRLEKAKARRALDRLESLLGRVRGFARARGLQLQTAAGESRVAA
jgi:hypothetical protein